MGCRRQLCPEPGTQGAEGWAGMPEPLARACPEGQAILTLLPQTRPRSGLWPALGQPRESPGPAGGAGPPRTTDRTVPSPGARKGRLCTWWGGLRSLCPRVLRPFLLQAPAAVHGRQSPKPSRVAEKKARKVGWAPSWDSAPLGGATLDTDNPSCPKSGGWQPKGDSLFPTP